VETRIRQRPILRSPPWSAGLQTRTLLDFKRFADLKVRDPRSIQSDWLETALTLAAMTQAKPIITASRVEAYVASALRLLGWLLGAVLRGGWKGRGARLRHILSRAELAVLKAVVLNGPPPRRRGPHPRSTPPGFARVSATRRLFFKRANIRAGKNAGVVARVLALINALAHPERAVAYFFKRICNGLRLAGLVPVAPCADPLAAGAPLRAAFSDSS
jgi:hypothetical protein